MARLFVAVWLPEAVADGLTSLPRKDQRGVRFVRPENWHITLRFLGEARAADVVGALDRTQLAPAVALLGPAVDVLDERALVIPVAGLDALAADVVAATKTLGSEPARKRFRGHVTLARVNARVPMPQALGARVKDEFEVTEIALVQSRLEPSGVRYEALETWPVG